MTSPLTARFQLAPQDVQALRRHVMRSSESLRTVIGAFLVYVPSLLAYYLLLQQGLVYYLVVKSGPVIDPAALFLKAIAVPLLLTIAFHIFLAWHYKSLFRKCDKRTPTTIELSSEGVVHQNGVAVNQTNWSEVRKIEAVKEHIFLWTPCNQILIVPRRAFESDENFQRFCEFARRHQQAAQPETPPIARV